MKVCESPKYEIITEFKINIDDLECGLESISLVFNETPVTFRASYVGTEPLSSLIEAVCALDSEYISGSNVSDYYMGWTSEPGHMKISLRHNLSDHRLAMEINVSEEENMNDGSMRQWNFVMNYSLFRQGVVDVMIQTLNKYGICGFNRNWNVDEDVLPIGAVLSVLGAKTDFDSDSGRFRSDLNEEIEILKSIENSHGDYIRSC